MVMPETSLVEKVQSRRSRNCSAVMLSLVGPDASHDDIALLILRRQPLDPGRHN